MAVGITRWLQDAVSRARPGSSVEEVSLLAGDSGSAQALLSFAYPDPSGAQVRGQARLFLPPALLADRTTTAPLVYAAGYELLAELAEVHLANGCVVVTPVVADPGSHLDRHPFCRGPNLDIAALHLARGLAFIDDAQVVLTGGSAGGYQGLMLAAESFPVGAVIVDAPVLDLGYTAGCFLANSPLIGASGPTSSPAPVLAVVIGLADATVPLLGPDPGDGRWLALSPINHLTTITCPVSMTHSTADLIVPVKQVGIAQPPAPAALPSGFTFDPPGLTGRPTLLAALDDAAVTVLRATPPEGAPLATAEIILGTALDVPAPAELTIRWSHARWSLTILDEGPPRADGGHMAHLLSLVRPWDATRAKFVELPTAQLTPEKLHQLMQRLAGDEWIGSGLRHLDDPVAERADVLRGLRTYARLPDGRGRLADLYADLPARLQLLGPRLQLVG